MTASQTAATFDSTEPATGEVVGRFPVDDEEAVGAAVARARVAARWWADLDWRERARRLNAVKAAIARRADELCELVHRENGKPTEDALIETILTVEHLAWAARKASKVLRPRPVPPGLLLPNQRAELAYEPMGVVGVIAPWNYPVFVPMGPITSALAAGNAVVFKPSEHTPAIGRWLADLVAEVVPEHALVETVTGFADTGRALCATGVDKIAFTGSAATGRAVMAACAETLTPVVMECGGNDAMIVDDDANLDAAATAAVWGGMQNAGQACVSVERVFVTDAVYERFLDRVVERAREVRPGPETNAGFGPITMPRQLSTIAEHLEDALRRGAQAVVGDSEAVRSPYVDPVVLTNVPDDALVMRAETFGPVLALVRVDDADEALRRANEAPNLGATVFSRARGRQLARELRAGMVSVNGVNTYAAVPALPWGGVGESGFGRVHGEDGLREFTRPKAITEERVPLPFELLSFRRHPRVMGALGRVMRLRHGRG